jgi:hypothetical protein
MTAGGDTAVADLSRTGNLERAVNFSGADVNIVSGGGGNRMTIFDRKLDDRLIARLRDCPWFVDLLSLWRPAGQPSGEHGLRLAIRNGYLNFYRLGQSVARVTLARGGIPCADLHIKYVSEGESAQHYARLNGGKVTCQGDEIARYDGVNTLKQWIGRINGEPGGKKKYSGREKEFVDCVLAHNPDIVDLEMGLPAFLTPEGEKVAPRMDIVALEPAGEGYRLVFWEAKLMRDSRLRSRSEPEVVGQLRRYTEWFDGAASRFEDVRQAYQRNCLILSALHERAAAATVKDQIGALGSGIIHVAHHGLQDIDIVPRLLIYDVDRPATWDDHRDRLGGIQIHVISKDGAFTLPVGA